MLRMASKGWVPTAIGCFYAVFLGITVLLLFQQQKLDESAKQYVGSEDRWAVAQTADQYFVLLNLLYRAKAGDPAVGVESLRTAIDILYSQNDILKNRLDSPWLSEVGSSSQTVRAMDATIAVADGVLGREPGPRISPESAGALLDAFEPLGEILRTFRFDAMATSSLHSDRLDAELRTQARIVQWAVLALVVASASFIAWLVWSNRQLNAANLRHRKLADSLRRSEALLRGFMDNAPATMSVKDPQRRYLMVNPRIEQFFRRPAAEMLGRRTVDFEDSPSTRAVAELEEDALAAGRTVSREIAFRRNGTVVWLVSIKFPIRDSDGKILGFGGIGIDISDQRAAHAELLAAKEQAEAANRINTELVEELRVIHVRLREALRQAKLADWVQQLPNGDADYASDEAAEILGVPVQDLRTKYRSTTGYLQLVHPADREWLGRYYVEEFKAGSARTDYRVDYRIASPDGAVIWIEEVARLELDSDGKPLRWVGTIQDITERKHLEQQLAQAQKMETVGQLTGGIAHDFNNLLAVIQGNLELVEERTRGDRGLSELVQAMLRAAGRGAELTHRLLAFGRRQALNPQPSELNEILGGMAGMLRRTLPETIAIQTALSPGLSPCLIDRGALEAALLNLVVNARDAMPEGGRLTIETANAEIGAEEAGRLPDVRPGHYVLLAVTDSGTGMSPETLSRAFEPFYSTKEVGKGSGLGLSMVYGFVKQSGGHVKIYSELGHGTTVKLYLPNAGAVPDVAGESATLGDGGAAGRGEVVLVVEDDPDVLSLISILLTNLGYRVLEAKDGHQALATLDGGDAVDLLLTDVVLPQGLSGVELASRAAQLRPGLKVLYMSGYTKNAVIHNGVLDEGVGLINKPFRRTELSRKVRRVLDRDSPAAPG